MKYGSRKFLLSVLTIALAAILPLLYRTMNIDPGVTMAALGIIGAVVGSYHIANVRDGANTPGDGANAPDAD